MFVEDIHGDAPLHSNTEARVGVKVSYGSEKRVRENASPFDADAPAITLAGPNLSKTLEPRFARMVQDSLRCEAGFSYFLHDVTIKVGEDGESFVALSNAATIAGWVAAAL